MRSNLFIWDQILVVKFWFIQVKEINMKKITLKWKILIATLSSLILMSVILSVMRINDIKEGWNSLLIERSQAILIMAESMRNQMAEKLKAGIIKDFDEIKTDKIMQAVPVVSAMMVALQNAKKLGYDIRIPKVSPRNPQNTPNELELEVLNEIKEKNLEKKIIFEDDQIRYFRPIRLTKDCLYCHGDPKGSKDPIGGIKEGWRVGEIHGAFEIITSKSEAKSAVAKATITMILWSIGILFGIFGVIWLLIQKNVIKPLDKSQNFIKAIAEGDMTKTIDTDAEDEFGQIAKNLYSMSSNLNSIIKTIKSGIETLSVSSKEMFEISSILYKSSDETTGKSDKVSNLSGDLNELINNVESSTEVLTANVKTVASSTELMRGNINDISQSTNKAMTISSEAVQQAKKASDRLDKLNKSITEIDKITQTITDISEQTNLLALNATIESARAGEAGKGFAVVSNEIKELSRQTSDATEEIKNKIKNIQTQTSETVEEIVKILQVINDVNEMISSVAKAMEDQSEATNDIASNSAEASGAVSQVNDNVSSSSNSSKEIAENMKELHETAGTISVNSAKIKLYASELSRLSSQLDEKMGTFNVGIAKFPIGNVKNAHLLWRAKLEAKIKGQEALTSAEVTSHKDCEFGRWYFGSEAQIYTSDPVFIEIGKVHEQVHVLAKEVFAYVEKGEIEKAKKGMSKFEELRLELFEKLDIFYNS